MYIYDKYHVAEQRYANGSANSDTGLTFKMKIYYLEMCLVRGQG